MPAAPTCPSCGTVLQVPAPVCPGSGRRLGPSGLAPGAVLQGRYRVVDVYQTDPGGRAGRPFQASAGTGFSRTIWKAEDTADGRPRLLREYEPSPLVRMRDALAKLSAFARLRHPNIASIVDLLAEEGRLVLVMEYVEGRTLEEILGDYPRGVPEMRVLAWGQQLCDVLDYLHRQDPPIVYRDLRPAVVLADRNDHVHLIDFGYARLFDPAKAADTQHLGLPGFVAPEMFEYAQTDARSDVYSLGVTLHRLITGHNPGASFPDLPRARELNPAISPEIDAVIVRATRPEPAERYPTAAAMGAALRACPAFRPAW